MYEAFGNTDGRRLLHALLKEDVYLVYITLTAIVYFVQNKSRILYCNMHKNSYF